MKATSLHRLSAGLIAYALTMMPLSARADDASAETNDEESPAPPKTVRVRLAGGTRVFLEQVNTDGAWRQVCRAPCGEDVMREGTYRLRVGSRVTDSFGLAGDAEEVELKPTTNATVDVGIGLTVAGATLWTLMGVASVTDFTGGLESPGKPTGTMSGFTIGAGVVAFTGIIVLLVGMSRDLGIKSSAVPTASPGPPHARPKSDVDFGASGLVVTF